MTTPIGRNDPTHELAQIVERMKSTAQPRSSIMATGSPEHVAQTTRDAILTLVTIVQDQEQRIAKIEQGLFDARSKPPTAAISSTE